MVYCLEGASTGLKAQSIVEKGGKAGFGVGGCTNWEDGFRWGEWGRLGLMVWVV